MLSSAAPLVAPFKGWLVKPKWADRVISRAYDNLTLAQRRAIAAANPYSYVNVTRSSEDLVDNEDLSLERLVTQGGAALRRLLSQEVFTPTGRPAVYLYRMTYERGAQTGVICTVDVQAVSDGRIRLHENVRDAHTELLTAHLLGVGAASSPVALAVETKGRLTALLDELTASAKPELVFGSSLVHHEIWTVPEASTEALLGLFNHKVLYVTDGHHRLAAAQRALAYDPHNVLLSRSLAAVYPADQLHVEAFHRIVIRRRFAHTTDILPAMATAVKKLEPVRTPRQAQPQRRGEVGVYVGGEGRWLRMTLPSVAAGSAAVDALDVELLRSHVLDPVLGADELGTRSAVAYLPEQAGIRQLVQRCDTENRIGFVMHPVSVRELMNVADEDARMPPKSSFFAPKPRSGAFLRLLARGATADLPPS